MPAWLTVVAVAAFITAPWFIAGMPLWGWTWVVIWAVVGAFEIVSNHRTGRTLSQTFRAYYRERKARAWVLFVSMQLGWALLWAHLILGW